MSVDGIKDHRAVVLKFDLEAASLLPMIMRTRLKQGKYFIFQSLSGQVLVFMPSTFDSEMVTVDADHPLRSDGQALQVPTIPLSPPPFSCYRQIGRAHV